MKKDNTIIDWDILLRKIKGEINAEEEIIFQFWINSSDKHRAYYEKAKKYYQKDISEFGLDDIPVSSNDFLKKLGHRTRVILLRKIMQYAAAIMLPLIVAIGVWYVAGNIEQENQDKSNFLVEIEPVGKKAMLITSSGIAYELDTIAVQEIKEEAGVKIKNNGLAGLKYEKEPKAKKPKNIMNTLITPKGGEYKLELSDGTKVWLNCMSKLTYPVQFVKGVRKVKLTGEAYFDVAKSDKPFIVETDEILMEVLGTKFNVMAYADEENVNTTLVSGKLKIVTTPDSDNNIQSVILDPDKQASFNKNDLVLYSKEVDAQLYTSWVNGYFRFENKRLEDVMKNISRWYDINVVFENSLAKEKYLTGKLYRFDDFSVITGMIERISGVKITIKGKDVILGNK